MNKVFLFETFCINEYKDLKLTKQYYYFMITCTLTPYRSFIKSQHFISESFSRKTKTNLKTKLKEFQSNYLKKS